MLEHRGVEVMGRRRWNVRTQSCGGSGKKKMEC